MEIKTFSQMFNDKHFTDYKKMKYTKTTILRNA